MLGIDRNQQRFLKTTSNLLDIFEKVPGLENFMIDKGTASHDFFEWVGRRTIDEVELIASTLKNNNINGRLTASFLKSFASMEKFSELPWTTLNKV